MRAELATAFADAATKLPKPLNDVFTRCAILGFSVRETAKALGLTVRATKARLFRAKSRLRRELQTMFAGGLAPVTSRIGFRS